MTHEGTIVRRDQQAWHKTGKFVDKSQRNVWWRHREMKLKSSSIPAAVLH